MRLITQDRLHEISMMQNIAPMTRNLLILNLLMFIAQSLSPELNFWVGLRFFTSELFQPYQLLTHMFAHGGLGHIFGNMLALFVFGSTLEHSFGSKRFLAFYLICGLGASLLFNAADGFMLYQEFGTIFPNELSGSAQTALERQLSGTRTSPYYGLVGASGAVFGILMAFAMLYPNVKLMLLFPPIPIKAKYFVALYGAYELYATIQANPGDNVAHLAHLGGMLFAFILVKLWRNDIRSMY